MNLISIVKGVTLIGLLIFLGVVTYDQLFSEPKIHKGIILHKTFIPERNANAPNVLPYGSYKAYKYTIQSQKFHQWIAIVKADDGDTLKVHCTSDHYEQKVEGDTLLFKEYRGNLFGIDYLSHIEEDTVAADLKQRLSK
ncbi:MAG: hypothetical protein QM734_16090 [Cyclobacteriaceae bacterium]